MIRRWGDKGRGPLQQPLQAGQAAGRAAVDPLPFLLGACIKHELLTVGQHPLGRQPPLREQEGTAVGAEGCRGPVQQVAVVFRGPQLNPAGLGRPDRAAAWRGSRRQLPGTYGHCTAPNWRRGPQPPGDGPQAICSLNAPSASRSASSWQRCSSSCRASSRSSSSSTRARHCWIAGITSSSSRVISSSP